MYALNNILDHEHLECWHHFVIACTIYCSRVITIENVKTADQYIMKFCETFENLYGSQKCTPNMHLHGHLLECILDYGPVYSFWCFPFERFNGKMEHPATNNHRIELTMMRKFLQGQEVHDLSFENNEEEFSEILHPKMQGGTGEKSPCQPSVAQILSSAALASAVPHPHTLLTSSTYSNIQCLPPIHEQVLAEADKEHSILC